MIEVIKEINLSKKLDIKNKESCDGFNMRIGIHTGNIITGMIGQKLDIFGENVAIANKMESNGVPGEVVISEETKYILSGIPKINEFLEFKPHNKY